MTAYAPTSLFTVPIMVLTAVCAGMLGAFLGNNSTLLVLTSVGILTAAQWAIMKRASGQPVPMAMVAIVGVNVVGVCGWLFFPRIADVAAVSARLPDDSSVYRPAAAIFVVASASLFAGGLISSLLFRPGNGLVGRETLLETAESIGRLRNRPLVLAASVPLFIALVAYTPTALLHRGHYSDAYGPAWIIRVGSITLPAGIALASIVLVRATARQRIGPVFLYLTYAIVVFSTGSRQLAMLPVMLLLCWILSRGPKPLGWRGVISSCATLGGALVLLQLPLTMRGFSHGAGLIPYCSLLAEHPSALWTVDLPKISGNILFSVPLTGVTSTLSSFPRHWLVTSLTPLPSSLTDWNAILPGLRLNVYTPTSGMGELANYGIWVLVSFLVVEGAALVGLQQWNSRLPRAMAAVSTVIGFGMTGALTLNLLQYNLRSGTRFLWYFVAVSVIAHICVRVFQARAQVVEA